MRIFSGALNFSSAVCHTLYGFASSTSFAMFNPLAAPILLRARQRGKGAS